jgi:hypothetical protein
MNKFAQWKEAWFGAADKPKAEVFQVDIGSQQSIPEGYAFLYKAPTDFLELYRDLFDNVPILESAVDVYCQLINCGWKVEGPDGELVEEVLRQAKFNQKLNDAIQSTFIYGFSGMETVLGSDMKSIIRFVNIPSERMRIKVDPQGNIIGYYQLGGGIIPGMIRNVATMSSPGSNPYKANPASSSGVPMVELNPLTFLYLNRMTKDGNPYGRSLFKTMPFITRIMLEVQDNTGKIFKKYGSPRFHVNYVPKVELTQPELTKRLNTIKEKFNDPKTGQDFFSAGDVTIDVIGANGQKMTFAVETAEIMQAIFSGLKLPAGMLGYNYGSTETHLSGQIEVLLSRLYNYQEHFEDMINSQLMPIVARIYGLTEIPHFEFLPTRMEDEAALAALESTKINNTMMLLQNGFIDIVQAQQKLELPINPQLYMDMQAQRQKELEAQTKGADNAKDNQKQ